MSNNQVVSAETLVRTQKELAAKQAELKAALKLKDWEEKTSARNPAYVVGSVRRATEADLAELGHCHGFVCTVKCQCCGQERTVNKQDAFQARFCKSCKKEASKDAAKERRLEKKLSGLSVSDLQAQIAEAEAQLAKLQAA